MRPALVKIIIIRKQNEAAALMSRLHPNPEISKYVPETQPQRHYNSHMVMYSRMTRY